ncbi:MAG: hypothetical protein GX075_04645 [Firmicutes bacterium]|nr:hypothetical protein [Bacillota bacterium]
MQHFPKVFIKALFGILIMLLPVGVDALGVQPLVIEMKPKPGETVPFTINLIATEKTSEEVKIALYQPLQLPTGELSFRKPDPADFPEGQWVKLNRDNALVMPDGKVDVGGSVKIPLDAKGSHNIIVMIEPAAQKMGSMELRVRYAARLSIEVDAPGLRPTARVSDFEIVRGEKGEPVISIKAENTSLLDYLTSASVTIRDHHTKKLLERVDLRPEIGWRYQNTETRLMRGCMLHYYGSPKEALLPGEYDLRLFYRFGNSGQIMLSQTVNIKAGDFVYPAAKLRRIKITPEEVAFSGKPGTASTKGIRFENRSDKKVKVILQPEEIETGYPYSLMEKTAVEFKNPQEFTLEPGRMAVSIIGVRFPKDAPAQGYYGYLKVRVITDDPMPVVIEEYKINLEAVVPGKHQISAELTGLSGDRDGEKYVLAAIVKNTGNIKISPFAEIVLKDKDGRLAGAAKLTAEETGPPSVIPTKLITLTGSLEDIKPGSYKAELKLFEGTVEIGNFDSKLEIK